MGSIAKLIGLDIRAPDFSTLSGRANSLSIAQAMRQAGSIPIPSDCRGTGLKIFGEGGMARRIVFKTKKIHERNKFVTKLMFFHRYPLVLRFLET